MRLPHTLLASALYALFVPACGDEPRTEATDQSAQQDLPWDQGGADIAEYSLGRLLIAHAGSEHMSVLDLDSGRAVGELKTGRGARPFAGHAGRYAYVTQPSEGRFRVLDPGQWLLSHLDHFHIAKSTLAFRDEELLVERLSSFTSSEGWIALFDAPSGSATVFQERSITALAFAPVRLSTAPHDGVALVSHAHLFVSEIDPELGAGISVRDVLAPELRIHFATPCSAPSGIVSNGAAVFVGCSEGVLALIWDGAGSALGHALAPFEEPRPEPVFVRSTSGLTVVLYPLGERGLARWQPGEGEAQTLDFGVAVADAQIRRQADTAVVLTADGRLHELDLSTFHILRTLPLTEPFDVETAPVRFVLSHAYAYVVDSRAPEVLAVRLRSMQLEMTLPVAENPVGIALVGLPADYTDERE